MSAKQTARSKGEAANKPSAKAEPLPRKVFDKANLEVENEHVYIADTYEKGLLLAEDLANKAPESVARFRSERAKAH